MLEKCIKNVWFLVFTFLLVVAFCMEVATLSFVMMNKSSTFFFFAGGILLIMTIFIFAFWTYIIFNQLVALLKEKKLIKKSKA